MIDVINDILRPKVKDPKPKPKRPPIGFWRIRWTVSDPFMIAFYSCSRCHGKECTQTEDGSEGIACMPYPTEEDARIDAERRMSGLPDFMREHVIAAPVFIPVEGSSSGE